jgi:hypothetical protein
MGIVLLVPRIIKKVPTWKESEEKFPLRLFWGLAIMCLIISTFQVWREEKLKAKEGAVFVRVADIDPKRAITNPDIFPIGQKASVNVRWTVFGHLNAMQSGQVYLADDSKPET